MEENAAVYSSGFGYASPSGIHGQSGNLTLIHSGTENGGRSGQDGTLGLAHIKDIGGYTIAQDPASCIIDGMPEAAIAGGCVDDVLTYMGIRQMLVESFDRVCV
jgi:hypothetical protein